MTPSLYWGEIALQWMNEMAFQGILMTDDALVVRGWNRWLEVHTGLKAEEAIGKHLFDLYPDLVSRGIARYYEAALQGQVVVLSQVFHRYLLPIALPESIDDLGYMQQTAQIAPLMHEERIVGTVTVITDVTERVARERALQRQLQQLMVVNQVARIASSTLDPYTLCDRVRERVAEIVPCEAFEILLVETPPSENLRTIYAWGEPAFWPGGDTIRQEVLQKGHSRILERRTQEEPGDTQGATSLATALVVPLVSPEGPMGLLLIGSKEENAYDASTLSLIESLSGFVTPALVNANLYARLAEREGELRHLIENARDIICTLSPEGLILSANPAFETITGWPLAEWIGRNLTDLLVRDDLPLAEMLLRDAQKGQTRQIYEMRLVHREGEQIVAEFSASQLTVGPAGPRIVIIIRDISERKRLEERLLEAQKLESIGRLAGGIAHDFNNILTAITGYATFVRDALPPGHPSRSDIQQVLQSADRAARLTQQLLAYSRKQILTLQLLDLNKILSRMEPALRGLLGSAISLEIRPSPVPAFVKVDPTQFDQIILNLVTNAREAMPQGGVLTIAVDLVTLGEEKSPRLADLAPGRYACLAVQDTGVGMTEEVQARIFEPFFTTKGLGKGKGLGLATVYGIVKQHEGGIDFVSAPGQGTTFYLYFPLVEEAERTYPQETLQSLQKGQETILVVDDEPMVRRLVVRTLTRLGYTVLDAANAEEALRLVGEHKGEINLLLTDVVMPQINGRMLAIHLRNKYPRLKTLYMSGYPEETLGANGRLEKGEGFIQKPFSTQALANAIRDLLDRPDPSGQAPLSS